VKGRKCGNVISTMKVIQFPWLWSSLSNTMKEEFRLKTSCKERIMNVVLARTMFLPEKSRALILMVQCYPNVDKLSIRIMEYQILPANSNKSKEKTGSTVLYVS
jgi:hypothetical protein